MNILSTLFIVVFPITQAVPRNENVFQPKSEYVVSDFSDCQTKCTTRRQTVRTYPPGTALFTGDKCACGEAQRTLYESVPATVQTARMGPVIPGGLEPRTMVEPMGMGNYGYLVFSANVQTLHLLSLRNDDRHSGGPGWDCETSDPPTKRRTATKTTPTESERSTATSAATRGQTDTTRPDVSGTTEETVPMTTPPSTELHPESTVTDGTSVTDESKSPATETGETVSTTPVGPMVQFMVQNKLVEVADEFNTPTTETGENETRTTVAGQMEASTDLQQSETVTTDNPTTSGPAVTQKLRNITASKTYNIFSHHEHILDLMINDGFV